MAGAASSAVKATCAGKHSFSAYLCALAGLLALCLLALSLPAHAWAPERFYDSPSELPVSVQAALPELMLPGEALLTAHKSDRYIHLLTRTQQDGRRLLIFEDTSAGSVLIYATGPLPEPLGGKADILSGLHSLTLQYGEDVSFTFSRFGEKWLLSYIQGKDDFAVSHDGLKADYLGSLPVSNLPPAYGHYPLERELAKLGEQDLPSSYEEAYRVLERTDHAVVNNPDPHDRLHLRSAPDRAALSLGKFYNGTLVQVLERAGDWYRVRLSSLEGWMMSRYLAEDGMMDEVQPAFPQLSLRDEYLQAPKHIMPSENSAVIPLADWGYREGRIIGLADDDWFVLMNGEGILCYMKQAWFWPGNG